MNGRSIRIFLVDGSANGILTAEIMNWTGHVLSAPRARIVELLNRPEANRTGVYFLIGSDPETPGQMVVYVGESDNVGDRLIQHSRDEGKGFWETTCIVTNKDANLTKAHVKYLESQLIALAKKSGRARLVNGTSPEYGYLPESDISDMEYFIMQIQTLLPVLGFDFLRVSPQISTIKTADTVDAGYDLEKGGELERHVFGQDRPTADGGKSPEFRFSDSSGNVQARALEIDGEMVILKGSEARELEQPSLASNVRAFRQLLKQSGKLVPSGKAGILRFDEDVSFSSPSAAAQAVMGTSRNGRTDWKIDDTGETYADWQERRISELRK